MECLHDPANVQQTSSKCIQNTRAIAGRLLDRVNILSRSVRIAILLLHLLYKQKQKNNQNSTAQTFDESASLQCFV